MGSDLIVLHVSTQPDDSDGDKGLIYMAAGSSLWQQDMQVGLIAWVGVAKWEGVSWYHFYATEILIFSLLIWQKERLLQSNFKYHPSNKYKSQLKMMV